MARRPLVNQLCVFSRPDFQDTAIQWGSWWTQKLETECPFLVKDLYRELATRQQIEAAVKSDPTSFWYIFGHGNEDVITGQDLETIINAQNIALWDQAWVHALSCDVFAKLGLLFKHGSGYKVTYYFYISEYPDGSAEQYYDSDHQFALAVWRFGASAGEAQKALKDKYTEWFNKQLPGNDYLPWDRDGHVISCALGDKWSPGPGIQRVTVLCKFGGGGWMPIGDMAPVGNDVYKLKWLIPQEGSCRLRYDVMDTEGSTRSKETGDFTVVFPESPIEIKPISPVGGEVIDARSMEISVAVTYRQQ